jgi:membrane protein involved in colicin uptake
MRLKGQAEKLMKQYQESEALHQVEALSHELLHMFVEMKQLAAIEDKMVEEAVLKQVDVSAIYPESSYL